jgi:hypothetical protein
VCVCQYLLTNGQPIHFEARVHHAFALLRLFVRRDRGVVATARQKQEILKSQKCVAFLRRDMGVVAAARNSQKDSQLPFENVLIN